MKCDLLNISTIPFLGKRDLRNNGVKNEKGKKLIIGFIIDHNIREK